MVRQIILITGTNQGIGLQLAQKVAAQPNIHLFITIRRTWSSQAEALEQIKSKLDPSSILEPVDGIDLANDESIDKLVSYVTSKTSVLDCLVNNAAISHYSDNDGDTTRQFWSTLFQTNVFGTVSLTEKLLPLLKSSAGESKGDIKGRIVNVSSDMGSITRRSDENYAAYAAPIYAYPATKTALNSYSAGMAAVHKDLTFICVCPGYCKTNLINYNEYGNDPATGADTIFSQIFNKDVKSGTFVNAQGAIPW